MPPGIYVRKSMAERLWAKTDCHGPMLSPYLGPCWLYCGSPDAGGYGKISDGKGHCMKASRAAYQVVRGPIPDGLVIDHLCRNPPCVNPAHLEPVTQAENVRRGELVTTARARMLARMECRNGHPYDAENTREYRGVRICKRCSRERYRRHKRKLKRQMGE